MTPSQRFFENLIGQGLPDNRLLEEARIKALELGLSTAQTNIATLQSAVATLQTSMAAAQATLASAFPLGVGVWTDYTPTLTQGGAVTKTVNYARYQRIGRVIVLVVDLSATGAGTGANNVSISLPVTAVSANPTVGAGTIYDTSAGIVYNGVAFLLSATAIAIWPAADGAPNVLGSRAFTAALASGDLVRCFAVYEAAP